MTQEQREMIENMKKLFETNTISKSEFEDALISIDNLPIQQATNHVNQKIIINANRIKKAGKILKLILTKTIISVVVIPAFVAIYIGFQIKSNPIGSLSHDAILNFPIQFPIVYISYCLLLFFISISILIDIKNISKHLINCDKPIAEGNGSKGNYDSDYKLSGIQIAIFIAIILFIMIYLLPLSIVYFR